MSRKGSYLPLFATQPASVKSSVAPGTPVCCTRHTTNRVIEEKPVMSPRKVRHGVHPPPATGSHSTTTYGIRLSATNIQLLAKIHDLPLGDLESLGADPPAAGAAESYLRRALEALLDLGRHVFGPGAWPRRERVQGDGERTR